MTRIFTDGAEMRDLLFWDIENGTTSVESATPAISPYYYFMENSGNFYKVFTGVQEAYFRFRVKWSGFATDIRFRVSNSGTVLLWLATDAVNRLIAQASTIGVLEVSPLVLVAGQWYLFEWYVKIDNAPNGRCQVYVDGTSVINYTGDTQPAALTTFDNLHFFWSTTQDLSLDDLAMNSTAGGSDNSWVGDGVISKIYPDGNGTHNNWHGSDGNDVNNYLLCQEFPKDNDITYNYHDNTAGTQQEFALSDWAGAGRSIRRIYAEARARKTTATALTMKLGQLAAGGADVVSAARTLFVGDYTRIVGDEAVINPVSGIAWTEADLDALEFVAEVG